MSRQWTNSEMNPESYPMNKPTTSIDNGQIGFHTGNSNKSGETIPVDPQPQDDGATITVSNPNQEHALTAGWLVCTRGKHKGQSFELKTKWNSVGRAAGNDVVLTDDCISRESMISIGYESRGNRFYIRRENGGNKHFVYINTNNLLQIKDDNVELKFLDRVDLNDQVQLIFVPLCGDGFNWANEN